MTEHFESQYAPDYVSPPGETLLEVLEDAGLTQAELARRMGMTAKTVSGIVKGDEPITPATCQLLERVLGIPATFWSNREGRYRVYIQGKKEEEELSGCEWWSSMFPYAAMAKLGWLPASSPTQWLERTRNLLGFFGVGSPEQWGTVYGALEVSYRAKGWEPDLGAAAAWLRRGEILGRQAECAPYDATRFRDAIPELRRLSVLDPQRIEPRLKGTCAECGVVVVFVPLLPKTHAWGATRWLTPTKALVQLSLKYKHDDHFWFTFFHECCHVLRHNKTQFLELDGAGGELEEEADRFAESVLMRADAYNRFIASHQLFSRHAVMEFASALGISPGIVVGRLQHDGRLPKTHLNDLKVSFPWLEGSA